MRINLLLLSYLMLQTVGISSAYADAEIKQKNSYNSKEGYSRRYLQEIFNSEQLSQMLKVPNKDLIPDGKVHFKSKSGTLSQIVYLYKYSNEKGFIGYCSAALVSPNIALTAKHCMNKAEPGLTVVVDDNLIQGKEQFQASQVIRVVDECSLEKWCHSGDSIDIPWKFKDYISHDYSGDDIVALVLETPMKSKDGYFKIHKSSSLIDQKFSIAGIPAFAIDLTGSYDQKYISDPVCEYVHAIDNTLVTNCIPASGISGGPLFYTKDGEYYLVGIVSSAIAPVFTGNDKTEFYSGTRAAAVYKIDFVKKLIEQISVPTAN